MGKRKKIRAGIIKEQKKKQYNAVLRNCPTSPRKMRLVADVIRGKDINTALDILTFSPKEASGRLKVLLKSAIANWEQKNEDVRIEDADLYVKTIYVDSARMLKRIQPRAQGRAYRIRKRSNHVTLFIDTKSKPNI